MLKFTVALTTSFLLSSVLYAQETADAVAPEAATETAVVALSQAAQAALEAKAAERPVRAKNWMVAAANPYAVEAGAEVLKNGGSAADAMVAVQAVLGLVEPQSSGLGGGAFLVWYDAESGGITTLDGRETAPLAATPQLFQDENGEPLKFFDAVVGGLSVGTPGTPALMEEAHRRWGKANWGSLFQNAIKLADAGFLVSPRLAQLVQNDAERLSRFPATAAYFLPDSVPIKDGDTRRNRPYAETLRALAENGSEAFYKGVIAEDIVATVRNASGRTGALSTVDLALYKVIERPAVCADYREYDICGMGPPSSGALTVGQILGILQSHDLGALGPESTESWRLIGDASRLAFADRGRYMADSDFVPVPAKGLIDNAYLAERARLLDRERALENVSPGTPSWDHAQLWGDDVSIELPSTSHISIVDGDGNALSMTTTIENGFGSRLMTRGGFLLNNELTDFSFRTHSNGYPIANRLEPGKRPRSSMAPTIVLSEGTPVLVIGSPGGSRIIGYVAQAIIAHLDWGMDVQQAVAMPHLVNRFGTYDLEAGTSAAALETPLGALGFEIKTRDLNSGLHAISINQFLEGGADPRREGIALGE
ncbi:gamma-glutamyltransferase [Pseudohalocynthiibacter aestuariivivens]|jgi:gamma-glutamyltranspeptidase / glutathione hydrolase|uniref:Glutathione hydrolase proenzyme n=1 Tax=Pseudohalocynthiibacter aestuariivivens TaxID=1591409 RepID=A0ABV5JC01_9RHOB|nr:MULTISPECIES: gamma-glutamyltransferase [Pseudohalocynthiibacter]MBS9718370.1 gamma-glutamyltransferase [Pseudohalocynthiibacter aestuariivivens]MCK0103379.1 gamma-glutamyltransferase [Pseudohalocynthiibacter sp. F2068]